MDLRTVKCSAIELHAIHATQLNSVFLSLSIRILSFSVFTRERALVEPKTLTES